MLCLAAAAWVSVSCGKREEASANSTAPGTAPTNAPSVSAVKPELALLAGKWERPDGGYVIEIKSVNSAGTLEAAYYNPNPIHVARAAALLKEGVPQVFIELRDQNYPGCTYSLTYDPKSDQLYGQYFQAAIQETYNVTFARLK